MTSGLMLQGKVSLTDRDLRRAAGVAGVAMMQMLQSPPPCFTPRRPPSLYSSVDALGGSPYPRWTALLEELKCEGRLSLFFSDGRKQDQARRSLENALGGKKSEYEKWKKEIEKREERLRGGGGDGGSGWGGGWFGWLGDNFWEESQEAILTILAIVALFLLVTKGNRMFVVIINPILSVLRGSRSLLASVSPLLSRSSTNEIGTIGEVYQPPPHSMSAKERVVKKWGD